MLHIMKTGGTSFRRMLISRMGQEAIYPNDTDLAKLHNGWYPDEETLIRQFKGVRDHAVLVGHFTYALRERLPEPYSVVAFFRDPVTRSISQMAEALKRKSCQELDAFDFMQDEEFVASRIANFQTKVLSAPFGRLFDPDFVVGKEEYKLAVENLHKLDVVGMNEEFDASCRLFDRRFGTAIAQNRMRQDNKSRKKPVQNIEAVRIKLLPHLKWDYLLYAEAKAIFCKQLQEAGIE